jgi:hypothetical protein
MYMSNIGILIFIAGCLSFPTFCILLLVLVGYNSILILTDVINCLHISLEFYPETFIQLTKKIYRQKEEFMGLFRSFKRCAFLVLLSSSLIIIFSQGCTTVHEMQVSQHNTSTPALTNAWAGTIAADMTTVLQTNDGAGDVDCNVRFERDGNITNFAATTGTINSQADFNTVIGLPPEG